MEAPPELDWPHLTTFDDRSDPWESLADHLGMTHLVDTYAGLARVLNEQRSYADLRAFHVGLHAEAAHYGPFVDVFDDEGRHVGNVDLRLPLAEQEAERARLIARATAEADGPVGDEYLYESPLGDPSSYRDPY